MRAPSLPSAWRNSSSTARLPGDLEPSAVSPRRASGEALASHDQFHVAGTSSRVAPGRRFFLPHRYEAALSLDQVRKTLPGSGDAKRTTDELTAILGLASVAVFSRATDGSFVREQSCGWPSGTAWHLLPDEALTNSLATGENVVALPAQNDDDGALTVRRGGRVGRAIFFGPYRHGSNLDRDAIRSLHGVFEDAALA